MPSCGQSCCLLFTREAAGLILQSAAGDAYSGATAAALSDDWVSSWFCGEMPELSADNTAIAVLVDQAEQYLVQRSCRSDYESPALTN